MRISDMSSYAFSAIKLRKFRSGLTTLGVVIGIAAIVALLSITQGLQVTISSQLQRGFATDTLIVSPGGGFAGGGFGGGNGFNLLVDDVQAINKIENVTVSIAVIQRGGYVKSKGQTQHVTIIGVDFANYKEIYSTTFLAEDGEIPLNSGNDVIVVGKHISNPWNNGTLFCETGDTLEIIWTNTTARPLRNETYTGRVVAILLEIGGFTIGGPSDNMVYIPISKAQSFFGTETCEMIIVKLKSDDRSMIDSTANTIRKVLGGQLIVTSSTAILNIMSSVFSTIELFLAGIAAISLLVAGIGIMNIMTVSVMERTREIGILKALGMKNRQVLLIFLFEAAIVGLLGTSIGIGAGWSLAQIVVRIFSASGGIGSNMMQGNRVTSSNGMVITPVLTPIVMLGAIVFGLTVSMVFALYPALRASKLKPVEALRYE